MVPMTDQTPDLRRKLTTVFCADVQGYSTLVERDEVGTVTRLKQYREIMVDLIGRHHGRLINTWGDGLVAEFGSPVEAVFCAVETQRRLTTRNAEEPLQPAMQFRIGINLGDVIIEGTDIYGEGVNIAARLESLADPGGICISGSVFEQVRKKLDIGFDFLGDREIKNIAEPVSAYRVLLGGVKVEPAAGHRMSQPAADDAEAAFCQMAALCLALRCDCGVPDDHQPDHQPTLFLVRLAVARHGAGAAAALAGRRRSASALAIAARIIRKGNGWGARDRTWEWRYQKPLPYRLATPQQASADAERADNRQGDQKYPAFAHHWTRDFRSRQASECTGFSAGRRSRDPPFRIGAGDVTGGEVSVAFCREKPEAGGARARQPRQQAAVLRSQRGQHRIDLRCEKTRRRFQVVAARAQQDGEIGGAVRPALQRQGRGHTVQPMR